ncbi:MAG: DUF1850 domain-containing protein [Rhizobiaceae bacterium]|nr:DUF1850 domain-containing protein [Rhizobiaceae bacterium]MCV0405787.1 DUF1850 domain-containing protein [Rhizobiaceae bacterium]
MPVCLYLGGKAMVLAATTFTLAWTHSVEKTRWVEEWHLTPAGLELIAARVEGTGAGMEIPDGAVLEDGVWTYRPDLPPQPALLLAQSGATGEGWTICSDGACRIVGAAQADPAEIKACEE